MKRRQVYVWGSLNNTEPPEDDDEVVGYYERPDSYVCLPASRDDEPDDEPDGGQQE